MAHDLQRIPGIQASAQVECLGQDRRLVRDYLPVFYGKTQKVDAALAWHDKQSEGRAHRSIGGGRMTRYYKSFKPGRIGPYSKVKWPKRIGAWVKVEGMLVPCKNGIHVARGELELLEHWLDAEVYEVEIRGERLDEYDKACVRECRLVRRVLDDRSLRLFAADCAEHALLVAGVTDSRSWAAVRVARLYAKGKATEAELDAAWGAAGAAARAAAWHAAWGAAGGAARAAAWHAARAAAWHAAWHAARAAAWDAAWDAARDAARDATRERQALLLRWYIDGETGDKPSLGGAA